MHAPSIAKQLQACLDEVNFVYRSLPKALERAEAITPGKRWRAFFHRQASILRDHQRDLRDSVEACGQHLRPCVCADVTERLNEAGYALAARPGSPVLERTVHDVLTGLRSLVMKQLEEAAQLAARIGQQDLSANLLNLLRMERAQERAHEEPWRK